MPCDNDHSIRALLPQLRRNATQLDQSGDWPAGDLQSLAEAGAMRWAVPKDFGGDELSALELYLRYESIARASLAAALILSQRDSAIAMIDSAEDFAARANVLERMARNEIFATVGIAQLTTSRQGGAPALAATADGDGYQLSGIIPWSTGAAKSDFIVAGAVLPDRRQILFLLPAGAPGVTIDPPLPLVALRATWTTQIRCANVRIGPAEVLRHPVEHALAGRKKGIAFGQAFLATGLCRSALDLIAEHHSAAAEAAFVRLERQLSDLRGEMLSLCADGREAAASAEAPRIRGACNDLALRAAHSAITLYKGTALLTNHPAQRLAREAMFLLVWSCPNPVIDCTVELLTNPR